MEFKFVPQLHEYANVSPQKLVAVTALPAAQRYLHFIKEIAASGAVCGLCRGDRWVMTTTEDEIAVFLLWPAGKCAQEFRDMSANYVYTAWYQYEPRFIELKDFTQNLLPLLKEQDILPGIFFTPFENGITPSVDELLSDIDNYYQQWFADHPREGQWDAGKMKFNNGCNKVASIKTGLK